MKVIPQEGGELFEPDPQAKPAGRVRTGNPLRFAPLTGILQTDASGGLLVRRVRVRVTSGPDRGREAILEAGTLLVGTHSDNDLILRDPQVGKYHLEIALVAGGIRVRDLGSEGGTFVGAARVQQFQLVLFDALANFVVACRYALRKRRGGILEEGNLRVTKALQPGWRGGVMTVTIDDQHVLAPYDCARMTSN